MHTEVATLKEIGQRLDEAIAKAGKVPRDVIAQVEGNPSVTGWYRWINGDSEAGCRTMAQLGLILGLRPDALLLKETGDDVFSVSDEVALSQIRTAIGELNKIFSGGKRPADWVLGALRDLLEVARVRAEKEQHELRIQTETIRPDAAPPVSVTAISREKRKTKAGGSGTHRSVKHDPGMLAGEAGAPYGAKGRKKK